MPVKSTKEARIDRNCLDGSVDDGQDSSGGLLGSTLKFFNMANALVAMMQMHCQGHVAHAWYKSVISLSSVSTRFQAFSSWCVNHVDMYNA